ncbi:hypothetical protein HA50_25225 [Pantoea cypripedii]|uniref:Glucose dehydrogenase n=2 Tax=Pantoea cypripedii TaxID=55209 RepID=A0A1X1ELY0_PANCY|nr:hypothetical protein HA50_25225 [Pantoea cypripedii]
MLGFRLTRLSGSPYYIVMGLIWLITGLLTLFRRPVELYLYALSFVATLIWALWESGLNGWALVPRLDLALLFLVIAVALMPGRKADGTYFDNSTQPAVQDWPTYGGGHGAQRFSTNTGGIYCRLN